MAKALKIVAVVAAVAAVAVVTGGAALGLGLSLTTSIAGLGISAGTLLTASALLGTAASLLSPKPKAPSTSSSTVDRLNADIVVRTPRKIVLGTTAGGTDIRDQEWSNNQTYLHRFIVVASHKVAAIREIWLDDKLAWTVSGGAQGEFKQWLQVTPVLEGSAANAINIGPRMGATRRYTGCAYVYVRFQVLANSKKLDSVFNQSVPTRMTIVCDGALTYDPRLDSTVPGGSGAMRAYDQSTWRWNAEASRNPAIAMLFYLLGWRINGKLAVGKGVPASRIDLASFITAANLCDEPVARSAGGTEPRYRCDGIFSEGDDPSMVLDNLKAAMNAVLDDADGRLRLSVLHNDLAAPIGELVTDDVLGAFTWQQALPLSDSVNIIRGGYTDPSSASLFQLIDYPEVRIASPDGIDRSQTVNLPLVQSASQAQRLVKQRLQRMLYAGTFTAVFQSTAWKYQKGDVVRFTFAPLGWYQKLFRIADMAIQVDGKVPMMLREENADLYAWDASDAAPVVGADPTSYDPTLWPIIAGLVDVDQRLSLVFSDNVITAGKEKRDLVREWSALEAQFLSLDQKYQTLGYPADLSSVRLDAYDAYVALAAALAALQPAWDDLTRDTPVDGAALNARWISSRQKIEAFAAAITGRAGADGASAFTLASVNNMSVSTNSVTKVSGGNLWNGKARTVQGYRGAAVTGLLRPDTFVGLTTDPSVDDSHLSIDYAIHWSALTGTVSVWRDGAKYFDLYQAPDGNALLPAVIQHDGTTVRYSMPGIIPGGTQHAVNGANEVVYGVFEVFQAGVTIGGITFAPNGAAGAPGASAPLIRTQWSINGVDNWHDNYFGADAFQRQSNDGGQNYGPAYKVVGENGTVGADGTSESTVFKRSATVPAAPADNTGNPPNGWTDAPPAGTDFLWQSKATFRVATQLTSWSAPVRISGDDGVAIDPNVASITFEATYAGVLKAGQLNKTAKLILRRGTSDISLSATWAITQATNATASISADGTISFSAVSAAGYVDATATFDGKTYPKRVPFSFQKDQAPPQTSYSQTAPANGQLTSTTFSATPYPVVTLTPNAQGQINAIIALGYNVDNYQGGTRQANVEAKAAYRALGTNTWSDFGAGPATGQPSVWTPVDKDPGGLSATITQGGLDPSKTYDIGLFIRLVGTTAGTTATVDTGTFTGRSA